MSKKKKGKSSYNQYEAGCYTENMIDLLGYDIIKDVFDASNLAMEDAQKHSNEVRVKALQCAGLFVTLIVALVAVTCSTESVLVKALSISLSFVFTWALHGIFRGIIYRKENITRGNVQSNLLNQQMINVLSRIDEKKRKSVFLASQLKGKELKIKSLNEQTERMQQCFERVTSTLKTLLLLVFLIFSVIALAQSLRSCMVKEVLVHPL